MTHPPVPPISGDGSPDGSGPEPAAGANAAEQGLPPWARRKVPARELSDEKLAVFIGPRWESIYRKKLSPFLDDPAFVPTWNWAAAFGGALWFIYRKLYLAFAAFFILPGVAFQLLTGSDVQLTASNVRDPANQWLVRMNVAVLLSTMIAAGGAANWFLFRRARAAIRLVTMQDLPSDESERLLRRIGGVNRGGLLFMLAMAAVTLLATLRA